jgi:seryl-tRNA synthetase
MAGSEPISTSDALIELRQARRTFEVFANAEKVCEYLLTVEQRQRDAEQKLADLEADSVKIADQIAERIKVGELRAEAAEQRAADIEKSIASAQAASDKAIADAKAKLVMDVEAAQVALRTAKADLSDVRKKVSVARETLVDLQQQIDDARAKLNAGVK